MQRYYISKANKHFQETENINIYILYVYSYMMGETMLKHNIKADGVWLYNLHELQNDLTITGHSICKSWNRPIWRASHGLKPSALQTVLPLGLKWCSLIHHNSGIIWCPGISTAQDSLEHTRLGQSIIKLISDLTNTLVTHQRKGIRCSDLTFYFVLLSLGLESCE